MSKSVEGERIAAVEEEHPEDFPKSLDILKFLLNVPIRLRLLGRRLHVYYAAYQIYSMYTRAENLAKDLKNEELDSMWRDTHSRAATTAVYYAKSLQGLWIKLAQFMSARSDVLPDEWIHALSVLQDAIPARPISEIKQTIKEEWHVDHWSELLSHLNETPLAAASIAQVHTAVIRANGQKIALKVQHRGVADLIRQDLDNAAYLLDCIAEERPDLDFRSILNEWCFETRSELDFIKEAQSTEEVGGYLAQAAAKRKRQHYDPAPFPRTPAVIRVPLPSVDANKKKNTMWWWQRVLEKKQKKRVWGVRPTTRLLPLEFIDGFKPTDREAVIRARGHAEGILRDLADAFGHNIFVDGLFNADPHPGNILIERDQGAVVLLDFGLAKRLEKRTRIGIARLVLASADGDVSGVLRAMRELGLDEIIQDDPNAAIHVTRFLFRDAAPSTYARSTSSNDNMSTTKTHATEEAVLCTPTHEEITNARIDLDNIDHLETNISHTSIKYRDTTSSDIDQDSETDSTDSNDEHPAYLSRATGKLYPRAATPGTILFVLRVIGCLRGIAVQLGVSQSYLNSLKPYAIAALAREQGTLSERGPPLPIIGNKWTSLRSRIMAKLKSLVQDNMGGIQLAAFVHGELCLNEAFGVHGPSDQRPISPNTLFSIFSCGKAVTASLALTLVQDRILDLDKSISEQPIEAARHFFLKHQALNTRLSPKDFLEHKTGLASAWPPKFAKALSSLDAAYFAPNNKDKSNKDDTKPWRDALRWIRRHADPDPETLGVFQYHAVSFGWLVGGLLELSAGEPFPDLLNTRIGRPLGISDHLYARLYPQHEYDLNSDVNNDSPWQRLADVCLNQDGINFSENNFFAADPRLINEPSLRSIMLPSATMHASAYGLAAMFGALANHGALADGRRFLAAETVDTFVNRYRQALSRLDTRDAAPFGFRPYLFSDNAKGTQRFGFGHAGLGQLHCLCEPDSGIGIAVCINNLASGDSSTSISIAEEALSFAINELTDGTLSIHT